MVSNKFNKLCVSRLTVYLTTNYQKSEILFLSFYKDLKEIYCINFVSFKIKNKLENFSGKFKELNPESRLLDIWETYWLKKSI